MFEVAVYSPTQHDQFLIEGGPFWLARSGGTTGKWKLVPDGAGALSARAVYFQARGDHICVIGVGARVELPDGGAIRASETSAWNSRIHPRIAIR